MAEYRIIARIGQGGMGIVYRAVQQPLDRPVAIKVLPSSLMGSSTAVPRFLREIQACTKLNHPNIIKIIDCGEIEGQPFFAMELLDAQTLREMLADSGPLPASQVIDIFRQVLEALEYCHREGVVHRDIKPHNIMVDHLNHATLMDFGLVKMLERSGITHDRKIVGSPNYMPPEVIQGKGAGAQGDIWSAGCVMYELLTGERAFPGKAIREIATLILKSEPVPVTSRRPDCPVGLVQVLNGCFKKSLDERYRRAEHVLKDLVRVEAGQPPLGPAALGDSAMAVPLDALQVAKAVAAETPARPTRPNRALRPTARAPVASTVVGLPPEARARRIRWRSLLPRTWAERVAAATALVVGVLALIVVPLARVSRHPPPGAAPLAMRLETGSDSIALAWDTADPVRAVATAVRQEPRSGVEPVERADAAPVTAHQLRFGGLERGVAYAITVRAGERVLYRTTARTLSPADLGERLADAIQKVGPAALAARLEDELRALYPRERLRGQTRFDAIRDRYAQILAERVAKTELAVAIAHFRPVRAEYFAADAKEAVPLERKLALQLALEALEDLRLLAEAAAIGELPRARDQLAVPGFGPQADFDLPGATVLPLLKGEVDLHTLPGTPDWLTAQKDGTVKEQHARLSYDLPRPLELPPGVRRVQVGLRAKGLEGLAHVLLWAGPAGGALEPVAVFRGTGDASAWSVVELDPRLVEGRRALKVELRASEAMLASHLQRVTVSALELRFR